VPGHAEAAFPAGRALNHDKTSDEAPLRCLKCEADAILKKEEELMATTTLAATLNTPMSKHRPVMTCRILIVENDSALRKILQRLFSAEGYEVDFVLDDVVDLERLREKPPSAVILDLQRPGSSGCDLCRKFANLIPGLPLLILSASSDVADKVLLLEMGADDYLTVPFSPRELVARVRALVRRATRVTPGNLYLFEDVVVDFSRMAVTRCGAEVSVTAMEFRTLEFLTKNAERTISRDQLLNEVWGYNDYPSTRTVDNHILRLRQKLESDPSNPSHLLTVHGMGYKFVP
jgi:DNA-binding response OmpR family regulator